LWVQGQPGLHSEGTWRRARWWIRSFLHLNLWMKKEEQRRHYILTVTTPERQASIEVEGYFVIPHILEFYSQVLCWEGINCLRLGYSENKGKSWFRESGDTLQESLDGTQAGEWLWWRKDSDMDPQWSLSSGSMGSDGCRQWQIWWSVAPPSLMKTKPITWESL
jgi:hypothetical protein